MGNSNVRSAPGTPTVSPGFERSDSTSDQSQHPLYKPHRKSGKSHGGSTPTSKRQPSFGSPSTPTESLPSPVPEGVARIVSKAGKPPPAALPRHSEQPASSSLFCSTPVSANSSAAEGWKPREAKIGVFTKGQKGSSEAELPPFQSPVTGKSHREICIDLEERGAGEPSHMRKEKNPKAGVNGHSSESQTGSSAELSSSSGVYVSPGEDESTDDYSSSSWNSALANQDFMKLYWPNQVDREDDPFQRASENLKEVSTEVSNLHMDLLGLLSRVDPGKRTNLSGRGSPELSSAFRIQGKMGREAPLEVLALESQGGLIAMAQNWESQLVGVLQKVTTSLNDLETLKGQNVSLIKDSVLSKSQDHPTLRPVAYRAANDISDGNIDIAAQTPKGTSGNNRANKPETDLKVKGLELEVESLKVSLAKSDENRQQLEGGWAVATSEHQQEAERLRTGLREQEARSKELTEQVRTLEAERRKEQGLRTQAEAGVTKMQDSLQRLQEEKDGLQQKVAALQEKMQADAAEWRQFQSDLQTAVAVADDFKQEAEEQLAAAREQLEQVQQEVQGLRSELQQQQAQRLGVDTVDTTERSRTLDGRKMPKTLTVKSLVVNGTSQNKESPSSGTVALSSRDNVMKSSSLRNFSAPEREPRNVITMSDTRGSSQNARRGERATSPSDSNQLTASDKWSEDSEAFFRRYGGSKRGIFLQWCQGRTEGYKNVRITNFSSCWADGMALCALLHTYLPEKIPYQRLFPLEKKKNLTLAFDTAASIGIPKTLTTEEMLRPGGPDWQRVLEYVESIHQHFEA
ncbi:cytospin-A-like [Ambystoma mexicanum]|uniref:cytospin-A-like n=1 Tax=Ambystoma mexicanum TaxID=8296 RepID=UPI0037E999BF